MLKEIAALWDDLQFFRNCTTWQKCRFSKTNFSVPSENILLHSNKVLLLGLAVVDEQIADLHPCHLD